MTRKETRQKIEKMIANNYAETHVGYHAEYRMWHGQWERGCYAQIAEPYNGTVRIYANSYAELDENVELLLS